MKKSHLIIICLLYSLNALSQETEVMKFSLPKGTEKIGLQQFENLSHGGINDKAASDFNNHMYRKNGLLIYYINLSQFPTHPERRHSLESYQKMMVSLISGKSELKGTVNIIDDAKIIIVNNIRYSIIKSHYGDNMTIQFTSDYDRNGGYINGFVEYKRPDENAATKYLQDFLNNMHYQNN
ncbi:MAG TPA: hypothetical protein VL442_18675 [Mucilaginibacter sp.]|jgi:hypothetical protein|nr:hypothetical protein [Mucilaginibacter sp.]